MVQNLGKSVKNWASNCSLKICKTVQNAVWQSHMQKTVSTIWNYYYYFKCIWYLNIYDASPTFIASSYSLKFDMKEDREGSLFFFNKESIVYWFLEWLKLMWAKCLAEHLGMLQKCQWSSEIAHCNITTQA